MKTFIIVDIDGTISEVGDRLECLKRTPKNWDEFYNRCGEDKPIKEMIELVNRMGSEYNIVFCTGRRESSREETVKWLNKYLLFNDYRLLMRPDNDFRPDTVVKPEQIKDADIEYNEILFILEDRNSVVKKWRELGVKCLQVAEGDF